VAGEHSLAIGREGHTQDHADLITELAEFLAGLRICPFFYVVVSLHK
jgi:hypothetical protein